MDTLEKLKVHKLIKERFVNVKAGSITMQDLEAVFDLAIHISKSVLVDPSDVSSYLWPDSVWIGHVQATPSTEDLSFAKSFVWVTAPGTVQGFQIMDSDVTPASRKSKSIDGHFYYDQQIVAADAGYLIIDTNA